MSRNTNLPPIETDSNKKKVIVIGAGFSGLSVAYNLPKKYFDVFVLEARNDHIGGRVHPYDLDGTIVDLGGQFVHEASPQNPMRQLMEELNIDFCNECRQELNEFSTLTSNNIVYDEFGKAIDNKLFKIVRNFYYKALGKYDRIEINPTTSFQDLLEKAISSLDNTTNDAIPDEEQFSSILNYFIHRTACYEGGRLHELSVHLDHLYQHLGGSDQIAEGGYNEVLNAVVSKIGRERIRLNSVVKKIEYSDKAIISDNSEHFTGERVSIYIQDCLEPFSADFCVCTVPLGVLQNRSITFSPDLSEHRYDAIDKIGMGVLDKVILKFDRNFWGKQKAFAIANRDIAKVKSFYDCSADVGGAPVLIVFLGGDAARRMENMDDDVFIVEIMEALRSIYGDEVPSTPIATKATRWLMDEYSYGSYSYTKVRATEDNYDEISCPLGNLSFAGEHTSKAMHSTVHGAWATGKREAQRLIQSISDNSKDTEI